MISVTCYSKVALIYLSSKLDWRLNVEVDHDDHVAFSWCFRVTWHLVELVLFHSLRNRFGSRFLILMMKHLLLSYQHSPWFLGFIDLTCLLLCWMFEELKLVFEQSGLILFLRFSLAHPNENGIWVLTSSRTSWTKNSVIRAWTNFCIRSTPRTRLLKWSRSSRSTTPLARTVSL